jgi:hypothetical protein
MWSLDEFITPAITIKYRVSRINDYGKGYDRV